MYSYSLTSFSMVGFMCSVIFNTMYPPNKVCVCVCAPFSVQVAELHWQVPMKTPHYVWTCSMCLCYDTSGDGVFKCFINHFVSLSLLAGLCQRRKTNLKNAEVFCFVFLHLLQGNINEGKLGNFFFPHILVVLLEMSPIETTGVFCCLV